jgi:hypothetical protein
MAAVEPFLDGMQPPVEAASMGLTPGPRLGARRRAVLPHRMRLGWTPAFAGERGLLGCTVHAVCFLPGCVLIVLFVR